MISLRKGMDADLEAVLQSALSAYRSALVCVGEVGFLACPPVGEGLHENLADLSRRLETTASSSLLQETERNFEKELRAWGKHASQHHEKRAGEVRDILLLVANVATDAGARDQRYAGEFANLGEKLHQAAKLEDLSSIRQSLAQNATALQKCVTQMTKDSQETIAHLRAQISAHETRLTEVERLASMDSLTGLPNRRQVERQIVLRWGAPFSVMFLDINNFKQINDTLGHSAGDDLLKQFGSELRSAFQTTDTVGRWGGDEFVVLLHKDQQTTERGVSHAQKRINGRYAIVTENGSQPVEIQTAIGIAHWHPEDTVNSLLQRADAAMYQNKRSAR